MNIENFIEYIITFDNTDDILDTCKTQSDKGFIFERLWDVMFTFGFCNNFSNSNFNHLIGNSNNGKLKILKNLYKYLNEKVISGNSGGCSDITLQNKNDDTFIFISSKYPKSTEDIKKQKSVDYYDIQKIVAVTDDNKHIYKNYKIYLLVPNKKKVLDKVRNANKSSNYITKHMTEDNILDIDDLNKYFLAFKQDIIKNINEDWQTIYLSSKEKLILRFHQELITEKTSNKIDEGFLSFLWGCKCRSGKTFMFGGIIIKQFNVKKKLNVLIITPAPTETAPQFTDDLFNKFRDYDQFKIHHIEGSKQINSIETADNNIFIISKQLLQKYINDKTIMKIKNLKLDIIGFDENHFSGTTDLSKDILTSYSSKNTVKIYLTATYNKPLKEWNILPECQMYWDIEDEQLCKSILLNIENINKLKEKHGDEYIDKTIKHYTDLGLSINNIFKSYENMPDLHLITNMFDSERYEIIKENIMSSSYGFSFDILFSLNTKKHFNYKNEIKTVLRYISGSNKEIDYKKGDKSILSRINKICNRDPFTQIWFLPSNNINYISQNLKLLMLEDNVLKNYNIMCINRQNNELVKDIKDEINKQEIITKEEGKRGLILLAGNMLNLGITINSCDIVILMNNTLSSDKVMQQMYRCMTEGENKNYGFVVDLNISRVINTCINYNIYKNDLSVEDKIKYLIENHLINVDIDMFKNKDENVSNVINKLINIWKSDPINNFKLLLRNLDNEYIEFDNTTQKLLNKYFTASIGDRLKAKMELYDETQELPSGKEIIINDEEEIIDEKEIKEKKEKEEIKISFQKDILPFIIPLTCILTIKESNKDFINMLNYIQENKELLDVFDDQTTIWWDKKDLITFIIEIIKKYFDKNSLTYNICINFKLSLQSLIDKPKELLKIVNECLKPKEIEKKQFGEVFTPMKLVSEMLDKLPNEVWTNKNLKWLDPASGMGNFPIAVYLRLMDNLPIEDEKERKKHILENMIYMSELNKKNVFITKQIFDIGNKYKLNIYEGDSLKVDYNTEFEIKQFDIIIGNPPYNASGIKASGNTIWQLFVNNSIKLLKNNGYICFVHPNGWRKPNTEKGKFYGLFEKMTNENIILYLEIHDTKDGMKQFNCGTRYDWYILQKKKNENHKTKILDQNNVSYEINLNKYNWLANCELELIDKLIANENDEKCKILQSMSAYEPRKKWISKIESKEFKYPVVHSTPKEGHRFVWSNKNDNGFYEIKKVIFGESGIYNPIIDIDGKYAMSQGAMAIIIDNIKEGEKLSKCLCSSVFNKIIKACLWSSFRIEWGMFKDLKKNFYELLDDKDDKILTESKKKVIKSKKNNNNIEI
jgi:hypothetical protein